MKSWLYVGARIVCVKPSGDLVGGAVYTVERITTLGGCGVELAETGTTGKHGGWFAWRFAPLITDETRATVAALKQAMRDHVAKNGAGIKRGVRV